MSDKPKHIVFLSPGFPADENDTTCIPALQIYCREMNRFDHISVSVIAVHYPFRKGHYKWNGIKVYSMGLKNRKMLPFTAARKITSRLKKINKKKSIDLIHSFWLGECAFAGYRFSKKHHIRHITTLMGQDVKKGNRYAQILPIRRMNIISLSAFQRDLFFKNYGVQTEIIPWGIRKEPDGLHVQKTIEIIGVGSLIKLKNYSDFIEVIHILKGQYESIQALIVGEGKMRNVLKNKIADLGLDKNIRLIGKLPYVETQQLIAKSRILLHPSDYESFGMVFAEAMANNTCIVSRKVGIAEESAFWFIGNSVKSFAEGCLQFLENKVPEIPKYPQIQTTIDNYLTLYNDRS